MNRTLYAVAALTLLMGAPARADGPDYEGTVAYIKSRLNGALTEQKQCVFGAKMPKAEHEYVFHAGALEVVPSVIKASEVHFDCRKGAQCIGIGLMLMLHEKCNSISCLTAAEALIYVACRVYIKRWRLLIMERT